MRLTLAIVLLATLACDNQTPQPHEPTFECVDEWTGVSNGVEYRNLACDAASRAFALHLVRVDPKVQKLDAVVQPAATAETLGRDSGFAINANFFDENFRPLGVVVSSGSAANPPHRVSWQAVFHVDADGRAMITRATDWDGEERASMAAQAGPRLVVNGKENEIARGKPDLRSGVCIQGDGRVVFFATPPESRFDVWEMRQMASKAEPAGGLGCRDALLFDGGPSTHLYLRREGDKPVSVSGDKNVPAFVVFSSK